MNTQSSHLFICMTPLQMLLAKKIIEQQQLSNIVVLVISYAWNDKFQHYYDELKSVSQQQLLWIIQPTQRILRVWDMWQFKRFCHQCVPQTCTCYLANINNTYVHLALTRIQPKAIFTYDDGTANLVGTSIFFQKNPSNFFEQVIRRYVLKATWQIEKIKQQTQQHFTIYPGQPNIIQNTKPITLFNTQTQTSQNPAQPIKILLGQPFTELDISENQIQQTIQRYDITYYFPHPREHHQIQGIQYLNSNLIFEDFIFHKIMDHPEQTFFIYAFTSTAMLNLASIAQCTFTALATPTTHQRYPGFYQLVESLGIHIEYL